MCLTGASWVQQNILEKHPEADLRVHVVWFNMLPGDSRDGWDADVLADPRVTHHWDEGRVVGRALVDPLDYDGGPIVWDAYAVYGPDAEWDDEPAGAGWTVIGRTDQLQRDLEPYLA